MDSDDQLGQPLLITIDGPAGAGKTTVSRTLSQRLGYRYIDTGALYRGIALAVDDAGIKTDDDEALASLCGQIVLDFQLLGDDLRLMLNEKDISDQIRSPRITMLASAVSARPVVRRFLLDIQRTLGAAKKAVFEGRDMGTVVFPDADVKFFLDADPNIRAQRRYEELQHKQGPGPTLQERGKTDLQGVEIHPAEVVGVDGVGGVAELQLVARAAQGGRRDGAAQQGDALAGMVERAEEDTVQCRVDPVLVVAIGQEPDPDVDAAVVHGGFSDVSESFVAEHPAFFGYLEPLCRAATAGAVGGHGHC